MLSDLEEVAYYKQNKISIEQKSIVKRAWKEKLMNTKSEVGEWLQLLQIQLFLFSEEEISDSWIKFTSLCYNNGMTRFALRILERLAGTNLEGNILELDSEKLRIGFQFLKLKWKSTREVKEEINCF